METERIALSQRERDRLKVLHEVKQEHWTQVEAARRLKRTGRHVRRMLIRIREGGDGGIVHRLRGRPSNRKLSACFEQKILARVRQRYAISEQLRGKEGCSQFGRSLSELGIEWIAAQSPQAKGRIERLFQTLQDRLGKELRLAGIDTIQAGNHFLEMHFLPDWEQRFTVLPRNPRNAHRRLGREHRLEEILSVRVTRKVADDHTVSWDANRWGVSREEVCAGLRGAQVEIKRRLDSSHWLRFRGRYLPLRPCPELAPRTEYPNHRRGFLPITRGGHFNIAENRTILLCVDTSRGTNPSLADGGAARARRRPRS
jgi:hypothetical protein